MKKVYLINQIDGKKLIFSDYFQKIFYNISNINNFEIIPFNLETNNLLDCIEKINKNADIVFIIHDFNLWNDGLFTSDNQKFTRFLSGLWNNKHIFVFPTELAQSALMESQLSNNISSINKIIINSEGYKKILSKINHINPSKIKFIDIPLEHKKSNFKNAHKNKILLTIETIHKIKDFNILIDDICPLLKKYKDLFYVLSLKSNFNLSEIENIKFFENIQKYALTNPKIKVYFDASEEKNNSFRRIANVMVFPQNHSLEMYNEEIISAISFGKSIVAATSVFTNDLVKNYGIFLYHYDNQSSFHDAISILLENEKLNSILEEQNVECSKNLDYEKIAQEYMAQIKQLRK